MQQIASALAGGALVGVVLTFVQFLIARKDAKEEKNSEILKAIGEVKEDLNVIRADMEREGAESARRRVLLFDDELRRHEPHSEESYNQVIDDINRYKRYCDSHPTYENNKAVNAIKHINDTYTEIKAEDRFI